MADRKCSAPNCPKIYYCARHTPIKEGQEYFAEFHPEESWLCFVPEWSMVEQVTMKEFENFNLNELVRTI